MPDPERGALSLSRLRASSHDPSCYLRHWGRGINAVTGTGTLRVPVLPPRRQVPARQNGIWSKWRWVVRREQRISEWDGGGGAHAPSAPGAISRRVFAQPYNNCHVGICDISSRTWDVGSDSSLPPGWQNVSLTRALEREETYRLELEQVRLPGTGPACSCPPPFMPSASMPFCTQRRGVGGGD